MELMNNAIYGKTMEKLRNRIDLRFMNEKRKRKFKMDIKTKLEVTKWFSRDMQK